MATATSGASRLQPRPATYAGLFVITLTTLMYEIVLTRTELKQDINALRTVELGAIRTDFRVMWASVLTGCAGIIAALIATQL